MWVLYIDNTSGKCPPRLCWDTCVLCSFFFLGINFCTPVLTITHAGITATTK